MKKLLKSKLLGVVCTLAVLLLSTSASIGSIWTPWNMPDGEGDNFYWQGGGSSYGLFGSDILCADNTLILTPNGFCAGAGSDEYAPEVYDRLEVTLIAKPGFSFSQVRVEESGDYLILGDGTINVYGYISAKNLDDSSEFGDKFAITPQMPISGTDDGLWSGSAEVTGLNCTRLKIVVYNCLTADAEDGSAAVVWNKAFGSPITIQIIPEPATVAILSLGAVTLLRRKKNC